MLAPPGPSRGPPVAWDSVQHARRGRAAVQPELSAIYE
jgi:hypothetical protein